jgi:archaellum component FlaC
MHLEQKINSLTTQYESISNSLQLPLPDAQRLSLTEELEQLEAEMEKLETQLADIKKKLLIINC